MINNLYSFFFPNVSQERDDHRAAGGAGGGGGAAAAGGGGGAGGGAYSRGAGGGGGRGGDDRRRRNDQPEEGRSRWESDRPRERERGGDRHRDREALSSQQAERQQHNERRRENHQRRGENQEQEFGQFEGGNEGADEPPVDKEKPNFALSGALVEDTNTFRGEVIKYNEPAEARIPKRRWRLYPFKNDEPLPVMYVHRQSAYLLGRQRKIADIPIDHPSCSKQHAVFQYR